ncbi:MAG: hypothetical protein H7A09_09095 [Oceanospirillaceae bacterium]|nr:hypothetical protein [Oceanospirillaceae bacterium]MCP5349615.1 hypothetical protein [Oceanospirillaceae bacterium]
MDVDKEVRNVLSVLRKNVVNSEDGSIYGDKSKALQDIDSILASSSVEGIKYLLLPTANLQELSIENGWGQEFNKLASQLENILGIS